MSDPRQLVLALDWGREPWQGRTPRSLTGAGIRLFSRREVAEPVRFSSDPLQMELWPAEQPARSEGPRRLVAGAPLLVPLKRRT